jgi:CRP-like cAMP-binding protein
MPENLLRKLSGFYDVNDALKTDFRALKRERINLDPGQALISAGEKSEHLYIVEDGWILRVRHMPGGARQIVNIALAGDLLCYNSLLFECSDYDVIAKTDASVARLVTPDFRTMIARYPGLAEAMLWAAVHEEALLAERIVSLGRRDSTQRLAHVLCEIVARLELIDRPVQDVLILPLIQEDFADILGISVIHVLRTFKRLAEAGAVEYRSRRLVLLDIGKLRRIAGFDDGYLHFTRRKDALAFRKS